MIADATFLQRRQRQRFRELAAALGAGFVIVECRAPPELLQQRLRQRAAQQSDASDADAAVLQHQLAHHDPLSAEERDLAVRLDAEGDVAVVAAHRCGR